MPDRTELDEEELETSSSTTDELSASEDEWSAESALPEGDEADEEQQTDKEVDDDQSTDDTEQASAADDPAPTDGAVEVEEVTETSRDDESPTEEQPPAGAPAEAGDTVPLETATEEQEESKKRPWVPWLVGLPIVAAIALVVGFLIADLGGGGDGAGSARNDPTLRGQQADWQIRTYVLGGRYVKGAPKTAPQEVEQDLTATVTEIHDALFLRPSRLDAVTKKYFSSAASKAFGKTKIGIPKNADEVQTTHRVARIGVDAAGTDRAVAQVQVAAEGKAGSQTFRSATESRLFLEKTDSGWKVIGYEVNQRPGDPFDKDEKKKKGDGKQGDSKKKNKKDGGKGKDKK